MKELKSIPMINDQEFKDGLEQAKLTIQENEIMFSQIDQSENDEEIESLYEKIETNEENMNNLYSMYLVVNKLNKLFPPNILEDYQYDVSSLFINKKMEDKMREYDTQLLKITKPDRNEAFYRKEISWLYLFGGFVLKDDLEDDKIYYNEEKILKKRVKD